VCVGQATCSYSATGKVNHVLCLKHICWYIIDSIDVIYRYEYIIDSGKVGVHPINDDPYESHTGYLVEHTRMFALKLPTQVTVEPQRCFRLDSSSVLLLG
jgi:hypothetical protein